MKLEATLDIDLRYPTEKIKCWNANEKCATSAPISLKLACEVLCWLVYALNVLAAPNTKEKENIFV